MPRMVTKIGHGRRRKARIFLKEWRDYRYLTQEQLAERIGTTAASVSRIETGARDYSQAYLEAAAEALSCEVRELFRPPDEPSIDDLLSGAPDATKRQARAILETLLKTGTD